MLVNESAKRCKLRFTVEDEKNRLEWIKFYAKMFEFEQKPRENSSNILWHNIWLENEPEEVENGYEIELLYDKVIETTQKSIESGSLYKMLNGSSNSFQFHHLRLNWRNSFQARANGESHGPTLSKNSERT